MRLIGGVWNIKLCFGFSNVASPPEEMTASMSCAANFTSELAMTSLLLGDLPHTCSLLRVPPLRRPKKPHVPQGVPQ